MAEQLRQEGRREGADRFFMNLLEQKFKTIPNHYKQRIEKTTPKDLKKIGD